MLGNRNNLTISGLLEKDMPSESDSVALKACPGPHVPQQFLLGSLTFTKMYNSEVSHKRQNSPARFDYIYPYSAERVFKSP